MPPANEDFPQHLKQFIAQQIRSVSQLEMLLLVRSDRERSWTSEELGRALYLAAEMCAQQLEELEAGGLVKAAANSERRYSYAPADAVIDRTVGELAEMYQQRRVSVITAIYSEPIDKIRTFAEAFRFRKEK